MTLCNSPFLCYRKSLHGCLAQVNLIAFSYSHELFYTEQLLLHTPMLAMEESGHLISMGILW